MSSNWDIDELEARKDEIIENLLKIDLRGEFGSGVVRIVTGEIARCRFCTGIALP
jgi:hypothetical protein